MTQFEEITGGGTYAKFEAPGDKYTGKFVSGGIASETDFDSNPCPGIILDTDDGLITVCCSQASIKRKAETAYSQGKLTAGALVEVELTGYYDTKAGSKGKDFRLAVAPPALVDIDDSGF